MNPTMKRLARRLVTATVAVASVGTVLVGATGGAASAASFGSYGGVGAVTYTTQVKAAQANDCGAACFVIGPADYMQVGPSSVSRVSGYAGTQIITMQHIYSYWKFSYASAQYLKYTAQSLQSTVTAAPGTFARFQGSNYNLSPGTYTFQAEMLVTWKTTSGALIGVQLVNYNQCNDYSIATPNQVVLSSQTGNGCGVRFMY